MNTYEKSRGEGVLLLTTHPMRMRILSERSESKDLSSNPEKNFYPEGPPRLKDLSTHPAGMVIPPAPKVAGRTASFDPLKGQRQEGLDSGLYSRV
jgi:hypothetical protein